MAIIKSHQRKSRRLRGQSPTQSPSPVPSHHSEEEATTVPAQSLPQPQYMSQLWTLSHQASPPVQHFLGTLSASTRDVDKWEIIMSPTHYGQQFNSTLAVIKLSSHFPGSLVDKGDRAGDRGEHFSNWLLLAEGGHQLWVDPVYKEAFYKELKQWRTVQPAAVPWVSTYGSPQLPVSLLVHCLNTAHCPSILLKSYGQKLPLSLLGTEPAQVEHPLSHFNMWDIGVTFKSPWIFLFSPSLGRSRHINHFPILVPLSRDFGSLQMDVPFKGDRLRVKLYPRLVHVLKSFNSRLQGDILRNLKGVKRRIEACSRLIHNLDSVPPGDMGGFRLEVTVPATSLASAQRLASSLPFFNIQYWRDPVGHGGTEEFKVDMVATNKEALLCNANWMVHKAEEGGHLTGRNGGKPSMLQKQVAADVLSSLGWNAGKRTPTKSLDPNAWWKGDREERERWTERRTEGGTAGGTAVGTEGGTVQRVEGTGVEPRIITLLARLTRAYGGQGGLGRLLKLFRARSFLGYVPCQRHRGDKHRYHSHGQKPPKLRCAEKDCHHTLSEAAALRWMAKLVDEGQLPVDALEGGTDQMVGDMPGQEEEEEVEEPVEDNFNIIIPRTQQPRTQGTLLYTALTLAPHHTIKAMPIAVLNKINTVPPLYHSRGTKADGSCMFRAFAQAMDRGDITHQSARDSAVQWMRGHSDEYVPFYEGGLDRWDDYLGDMAREGTWGDNLTLQALCDAYLVHIMVLKVSPGGRMDWLEVGGDKFRAKAAFGLYLKDQHYENLLVEQQVTA